MINRERLLEVLEYDPDTGIFRWRIAFNKKAVVGREAGSINKDGYIVIGIDGSKHYAHRLAWFYVTGEMPPRIDHENCKEGDNRFCNLRLATKSQNAANVPRQAKNTSGHKGVYWSKCARKWQAQIVKDGQNHYLGIFDDIEEAAQAYRDAAKTLFQEYARS